VTDQPEPTTRRVTRYMCPHCSRGHWSKATAVEHIARCWWNPDARGCKTCAHFSPAEAGPYREHPGFPEECEADEGHDLTAGLRTACAEWEATQ
jgi:hypothetical protein